MTWTTIVTTAPRVVDTLPQCVISLIDAGLDPIIFSEPGSALIPECLTIHNSETLGAWHNWRKAIEWALDNTDADLILSVQDDCVIHPQSRSFIDTHCLWPSPNAGLLSLYCPSIYNYSGGPRIKPAGIYNMQIRLVYGACALLFPRNVLEKCRKSFNWDNWYGVKPDTDHLAVFEERKNNPHTIKHVDAAITRMLKEQHREFWYLIPSLSQHISEHSTLGHASNVGKRRASHVVDHTIDLTTYFPKFTLYDLIKD